MKRNITGATIAVALFVLGACSSSTAPAKTDPTSASAASTPASTAPSTTSAAEANAVVCSEVQAYFLGNIKATFDAYDPQANEFDSKFASDLRDEATHLFGFEAQSTGSVATAIHEEATGLTNISIAVSENDDSALAAASNAANSSLANLRGVCNF